MEINYELVSELDIPDLTKIMTRAFDEDSMLHLGIEKGGPTGYDTGEFFKTYLFKYKELFAYKMVSNKVIVGCFMVWILPSQHNRLGTIFIDPPYQNLGIGIRTWQFIENTYSKAKSWTLDTPSWATRNHYFYEQKCGFTKIEEIEPKDHSGTSFIYRKEISVE